MELGFAQTSSLSLNNVFIIFMEHSSQREDLFWMLFWLTLGRLLCEIMLKLVLRM